VSLEENRKVQISKKLKLKLIVCHVCETRPNCTQPHQKIVDILYYNYLMSINYRLYFLFVLFFFFFLTFCPSSIYVFQKYRETMVNKI